MSQSEQDRPNVPAPAPQTPPADQPHRPAEDSEQVYFEGPPLLRGEVGRMLLWDTAGLILIATPIVIGLLAAWPPLWVTIPLIAIGLALPLIPVLVTRSTGYRITNYRIDYERGLLNKRIDTLELWHVEDISFQQSLLERILGVGTITIVSHDETTPELRMSGLPKPRPLFEMLKQRVIAVKRQRGVIKMDIG